MKHFSFYLSIAGIWAALFTLVPAFADKKKDEAAAGESIQPQIGELPDNVHFKGERSPAFSKGLGFKNKNKKPLKNGDSPVVITNEGSRFKKGDVTTFDKASDPAEDLPADQRVPPNKKIK